MAVSEQARRWSLLLWLGFVVAEGLNPQDPRTADPPLPHPSGTSEPCARQEVIVGANLTGYGQVVLGNFTVPSAKLCCPFEGLPSSPDTCWGQIVLELRGAVQGVQFDRYGAVWFRGTEILRLTTPEPTTSGIRWGVDRDVTDYLPLFTEPGQLALQIPNVVDATYTGVLHVNVSVVFYPVNSEAAAASGSGRQLRSRRTTASNGSYWKSVRPLTNTSQSQNPINSVAVNGPLGQSTNVTLPLDVVEVKLDVYASGHQCEEFWYTNTPDAETPSGGCGGGAYRELLVHVDGVLAGACFPFPVVYTGGINPLLWRPLTGISSFDVPPYSFDLTPFIAWLTDGQPHNITLSVYDNNPTGTWYLDGVLVLKHGPHKVAGGTVKTVQDTPPQVSQDYTAKGSDSYIQTMSGQHRYRVVGQALLENGDVVESEVEGELVAWSVNRAPNSAVLTTNGVFFSRRVSKTNGLQVTRKESFPLHVNDTGIETNVSLLLEATIRYARSTVITFEEDQQDPYTISLWNGITANAVYQRTRGSDRKILEASSKSKEVYQIKTSDSRDSDLALCYNRSLQEYMGTMIEDVGGKYSCNWPRGIYVCGGQLCGAYSSCSNGPSTSWSAPLQPPHEWEQAVKQMEAVDLKLLGSEDLDNQELVDAMETFRRSRPVLRYLEEEVQPTNFV